MTGEEWALAATCFFSGLGAGLLGMLCTILRPWLAAMDGRGFRNFMGEFLWYAADLPGFALGKVYNYAWSLGMTIGPIVALVLLWDDRGSTSFVLTAIGLGIVIVGILIVSNVWKTPTYKVILSWDPEALPAGWEAVRRRYFQHQLGPNGDDLVGVHPLPGGHGFPVGEARDGPDRLAVHKPRLRTSAPGGPAAE